MQKVKVTSGVYPNYWIDGDPRTRQSDQWWRDKYVRECSHLAEQAFSEKQSNYMNMVTYPMKLHRDATKPNGEIFIADLMHDIGRSLLQTVALIIIDNR